MEELEIDFKNSEKEEEKLSDEKYGDSYPPYGTKEWEDYVLSLLRDDEKDGDFPKCVGLRRISNILGNIIFSGPISYSAPSNDATVPPRATVHYQVQINWCLDKPVWVSLKDSYDDIRTFSALADCDHHNTQDVYAVHPTATAESRAESRCLRKALGLSVLSAEEMSNDKNPTKVIKDYETEKTSEVDNEGPITETQIKMITAMSKKLKIDVIKFINMEFDSIKFKSLNELNMSTAASKMSQLQKFQNEDIPENVRISE